MTVFWGDTRRLFGGLLPSQLPPQQNTTMSSPSPSSRKRPYTELEGVDNDAAAIGGVCPIIIDGRAEEAADRNVGVEDVVASKGTEATASPCDDDDDDGSCDSDAVEDKDPAVIAELRAALEYLIDENEQPQSHPPSLPTQPPTTSRDKQLYQLPNLVNRIMMEHYTVATPNKQSHKKSDTTNTATSCMTRQQRELMTQLLVAVIVEFAESHFVRMARHRRRMQRDKLLEQQLQKSEKKKSRTNDVTSSNQRAVGGEEDTRTKAKADESAEFQFSESAVSWATQCIGRLLQPSISISSSNLCNKDGTTISTTIADNSTTVEEAHISELDALLAATGPCDGMELELRMQNSLLCGVQGHRMLLQRARMMFGRGCG